MNCTYLPNPLEVPHVDLVNGTVRHVEDVWAAEAGRSDLPIAVLVSRWFTEKHTKPRPS